MRLSSFGERDETPIDTILKVMRYRQVARYVPRGAHIIDIGCGYRGEFLERHVTKIGFGVGLDLSVASFRNAENICLLRAPIYDSLPFANESFDVAIALALIEHLSQPRLILREIFRILKPKGLLLITTPSQNAKSILEFLAFRLRVVSAQEIADHKMYYRPETLARELIQAGFKADNIIMGSFEFGLNLLVRSVK